MGLDESRFATLADETLRRILHAVDLTGELDADLREGVLTIDTEDGRQFVVNRHGPNREIWVSSPLSGAWHFAYDEASDQWVDTRAKSRESALSLFDHLSRELSMASGDTITIE